MSLENHPTVVKDFCWPILPVWFLLCCNWLAEERGSWSLGVVFLCIRFADLLIRRRFLLGLDLRWDMYRAS